MRRKWLESFARRRITPILSLCGHVAHLSPDAREFDLQIFFECRQELQVRPRKASALRRSQERNRCAHFFGADKTRQRTLRPGTRRKQLQIGIR